MNKKNKMLFYLIKIIYLVILDRSELKYEIPYLFFRL